MTALPDVVEGEVRELEPEPRALAVLPPAGLAVADGPEAMIALAARMATALKDIVERQRLYAVISGRKFPQVEAWMTIGRMDNVVAREARLPIRHDDGAYEAEVELVRLSDGMVIGRASALCGSAGDKPWVDRAEPHRRSMAVTRATSRAFRQQYSWIMALAGYEPTPAEEMPRDEPQRAVAPSAPLPSADGGLIGTAVIQGTQDYELRMKPEGGHTLPFRIKDGKQSQIVIAHSPLADALYAMKPEVIGHRVTVWGPIHTESFVKDTRKIEFTVLDLVRIKGEDWTLPAPEQFDAVESAAIQAALDAVPVATT